MEFMRTESVLMKCKPNKKYCIMCLNIYCVIQLIIIARDSKLLGKDKVSFK
jgi:hypothetical protein